MQIKETVSLPSDYLRNPNKANYTVKNVMLPVKEVRRIVKPEHIVIILDIVLIQQCINFLQLKQQ